MDKLEWAVDTVDGTTFEKIAGEILRNEGYDVHESGVIGTDGGWDARIEINGRKGIGHASVDNNWRGKLRDDAESVEELEEELGESFDLLVFVTNQRVTGQQELDMEAEIDEEYGWDLKILHRRHIIGITGHERPDLAERHFGFKPKRNDDHLEQIIQLRDERLDLISNRDGVASDLEDGPVAVVHLIPNGVFSGNYVQRSDDLPGLPRMGKLNVHPGTETVGKGKLNAGGRMRQPYKSYTYLQKGGLYEAVDTWVFREDDQDGLLLNNARDTDKSLDCKAGIAVQAGIRAFEGDGCDRYRVLLHQPAGRAECDHCLRNRDIGTCGAAAVADGPVHDRPGRNPVGRGRRHRLAMQPAHGDLAGARLECQPPLRRRRKLDGTDRPIRGYRPVPFWGLTADLEIAVNRRSSMSATPLSET